MWMYHGVQKPNGLVKAFDGVQATALSHGTDKLRVYLNFLPNSIGCTNTF
jgi:hypothetical protein